MLQRAARLAAATLPLALLCACLVGPNVKTPHVEVAEKWSAAAGDEDPAELAHWWKQFNDAELDQLVSRALARNLDLQSAVTLIAQARAQLVGQAAGLLPSASLAGRYSKYKIPADVRDQIGNAVRSIQSQDTASGSGEEAAIPHYFDFFQLGFDVSWELDLWGGTRRGIQSAAAALDAQIWERRGAVVSVLAELGSHYATLRMTQARLRVAQRNLEIARIQLELTRSLHDNGLGSDIDLAQAEGNLELVQAAEPPLRSLEAQSIHAIAVLLGELPESLQTELRAPHEALQTPHPVPAGLPAQLLANRPDIRAADAQYSAAVTQIGVATAQRLPNLALTGTAGVSSTELSHLLSGNAFSWNIGAAITAPLFDAGRLRANQRAAEARALQQEFTYRKTVLQAFAEVENGLTTVHNDGERDAALQRAALANERALERAMDQFKHGQASYLQVLSSETSVNSTTDQQLQTHEQHLRDFISVYKALGGGWQPAN